MVASGCREVCLYEDVEGTIYETVEVYNFRTGEWEPRAGKVKKESLFPFFLLCVNYGVIKLGIFRIFSPPINQ